MKRTNIYLPDSIILELEKLSAESGESMSEIIRTAVKKYISFDNREAGGYLCLLALSFAMSTFDNDHIKNPEIAANNAGTMFYEAKRIYSDYCLDDSIYRVISVVEDFVILSTYEWLFLKTAERKEKYIYILQNKKTGFVKIGISVDPEKRAKSLQCGSGGEIEVIRKKIGTYQDESRLHSMFSGKNITGEWFTYSDEIIKAFDEL